MPGDEQPGPDAPAGNRPVRTHLLQARRSAWARSGEGLLEVRRSWRVILQATVAATLAFALASAIGHETPFFAPIAAIATVAVSLAHRLRRATELLIGNAVGILLADLLIARIGTGAWQLGLVVALALASAILLGGGPILIMQASSAAILIATLVPPTAAEPWNVDRFVDALIGGGVGLLVSALLMPVDPAKQARRATEPLLGTLARGYSGVARALLERDPTAAEALLAELRGTAPIVTGFQAGLDATRESVRLAPWYWGQRALLAAYALAGVHLDHALRNLRVLARQAAATLRRGEEVPAPLAEALQALAEAANGLGPALAGEVDPDVVVAHLRLAIDRCDQASAARPAAEPAAHGPQSGPYLAAMLGQVRLSAADLLQALGLPTAQTRALVHVGDAADPG
ncbi:MAG: FUSC family protein [Candidatus Nanopelagicales bacterium]|nr:FUSC family protein [Candidatus Nanopelagicales bacterium]